MRLLRQPKVLTAVPAQKLLAYLYHLERQDVDNKIPPMRSAYGGIDVCERYFGVHSVEDVQTALRAMP